MRVGRVPALTFWVCTVAVLGTGCQGSVTGKGSKEDALSPPPEGLPFLSGLRRLSRDEYDNTVRDLLSDTTRSGFGVLPEDVNDPFDNDYKTQLASGALVEGVELLAQNAAKRALADPGKRDFLVQCVPSSPADELCLRKVITTFGRRALRRPLTQDEVTSYLGLQQYAVERNDFFAAVELVLTAMLQDPEFLYRVERGTPVEGSPGRYKLNPFEQATRLAYFLWGSTPPDWLLDAAQAGPLDVVAAATRLLEDPRAKARVNRFHALWLGFHQLPHPVALTQAMQKETAALVEKVVFTDRADYLDLFRSTESFVDSTLATHYGLPNPGTSTFSWVSYAASGRQGILSHGSVLSAGAKFEDTSPTQRGIFVRNRLLCTDIPPPPPNANVDEMPTSPTSNCKVDRYAEHANSGNCAGCHQAVDPIGFGLERFDRAGRYREHDLNEPTCAIPGTGKVMGLGDFSGPAGLSDLLVRSGRLESCIVTQVFRFAMGRREVPGDTQTLESLTSSFQSDQRRFDGLLLSLVASEAFTYRQEAL